MPELLEGINDVVEEEIVTVIIFKEKVRVNLFINYLINYLFIYQIT